MIKTNGTPKKTKVSYNVTKCVLKMAIKFWILKKQYGPLKLFSCIVHSKFSGFEQKIKPLEFQLL